MSATRTSKACDRVALSRRCIPEEFTPLFHTPAYGALTAEVRLRYNELHAFYFNEQVAFFEQEMLSPAIRLLAHAGTPTRLAEGLQQFFTEEQRHTAMFRALNRECAPDLYSSDDYYFVRVTRPLRTLLQNLSARPRIFPLIFWLALLQEERSLFYSRECLNQALNLDPRFVAIHRAHLADEVGHVRWDEEILNWLWPRTSALLRAANVRLLAWMLGEFFLLPKRSGRRVVERLASEQTQLDATDLYCGLHGLRENTGYLAALYSREVTPRAFALFDVYPEFALLAKTLPGYVPSRA